MKDVLTRLTEAQHERVRHDAASYFAVHGGIGSDVVWGELTKQEQQAMLKIARSGLEAIRVPDREAVIQAATALNLPAQTVALAWDKMIAAALNAPWPPP